MVSAPAARRGPMQPRRSWQHAAVASEPACGNAGSPAAAASVLLFAGVELGVVRAARTLVLGCWSRPGVEVSGWRVGLWEGEQLVR